LLLPRNYQTKILLYGQEITAIATAQQQNAEFYHTQTGGYTTHRVDKSHPYGNWHEHAAARQ